MDMTQNPLGEVFNLLKVIPEKIYRGLQILYMTLQPIVGEAGAFMLTAFIGVVLPFMLVVWFFSFLQGKLEMLQAGATKTFMKLAILIIIVFTLLFVFS